MNFCLLDKWFFLLECPLCCEQVLITLSLGCCFKLGRTKMWEHSGLARTWIQWRPGKLCCYDFHTWLHWVTCIPTQRSVILCNTLSDYFGDPALFGKAFEW